MVENAFVGRVCVHMFLLLLRSGDLTQILNCLLMVLPLNIVTPPPVESQSLVHKVILNEEL